MRWEALDRALQRHGHGYIWIGGGWRVTLPFHSLTSPLINTWASARWKDAGSWCELFQQFAARGEKPLKRLDLRRPAYPPG
jgi:hypothetical protein